MIRINLLPHRALKRKGARVLLAEVAIQAK